MTVDFNPFFRSNGLSHNNMVFIDPKTIQPEPIHKMHFLSHHQHHYQSDSPRQSNVTNNIDNNGYDDDFDEEAKDDDKLEAELNQQLHNRNAIPLISTLHNNNNYNYNPKAHSDAYNLTAGPSPISQQDNKNHNVPIPTQLHKSSLENVQSNLGSIAEGFGPNDDGLSIPSSYSYNIHISPSQSQSSINHSSYNSSFVHGNVTNNVNNNEHNIDPLLVDPTTLITTKINGIRIHLAPLQSNDTILNNCNDFNTQVVVPSIEFPIKKNRLDIIGDHLRGHNNDNDSKPLNLSDNFVQQQQPLILTNHDDVIQINRCTSSLVSFGISDTIERFDDVGELHDQLVCDLYIPDNSDVIIKNIIADDNNNNNNDINDAVVEAVNLRHLMLHYQSQREDRKYIMPSFQSIDPKTPEQNTNNKLQCPSSPSQHSNNLNAIPSQCSINLISPLVRQETKNIAPNKKISLPSSTVDNNSIITEKVNNKIIPYPTTSVSRIYLAAWLTFLGYFTIFAACDTVSALSTSIFKSKGLLSSAMTYIVAIICALAGPILVDRVKPLIVVAALSLAYTIYIGCNFHAKSVIIGGFIIGLGGLMGLGNTIFLITNASYIGENDFIAYIHKNGPDDCDVSDDKNNINAGNNNSNNNNSDTDQNNSMQQNGTTIQYLDTITDVNGRVIWSKLTPHQQARLKLSTDSIIGFSTSLLQVVTNLGSIIGSIVGFCVLYFLKKPDEVLTENSPLVRNLFIALLSLSIIGNIIFCIAYWTLSPLVFTPPKHMSRHEIQQHGGNEDEKTTKKVPIIPFLRVTFYTMGQILKSPPILLSLFSIFSCYSVFGFVTSTFVSRSGMLNYIGIEFITLFSAMISVFSCFAALVMSKFLIINTPQRARLYFLTGIVLKVVTILCIQFLPVTMWTGTKMAWGVCTMLAFLAGFSSCLAGVALSNYISFLIYLPQLRPPAFALVSIIRSFGLFATFMMAVYVKYQTQIYILIAVFVISALIQIFNVITQWKIDVEKIKTKVDAYKSIIMHIDEENNDEQHGKEQEIKIATQPTDESISLTQHQMIELVVQLPSKQLDHPNQSQSSSDDVFHTTNNATDGTDPCVPTPTPHHTIIAPNNNSFSIGMSDIVMSECQSLYGQNEKPIQYFLPHNGNTVDTTQLSYANSNNNTHNNNVDSEKNNCKSEQKLRSSMNDLVASLKVHEFRTRFRNNSSIPHSNSHIGSINNLIRQYDPDFESKSGEMDARDDDDDGDDLRHSSSILTDYYQFYHQRNNNLVNRSYSDVSTNTIPLPSTQSSDNSIRNTIHAQQQSIQTCVSLTENESHVGPIENNHPSDNLCNNTTMTKKQPKLERINEIDNKSLQIQGYEPIQPPLSQPHISGAANTVNFSTFNPSVTLDLDTLSCGSLMSIALPKRTKSDHNNGNTQNIQQSDDIELGPTDKTTDKTTDNTDNRL